MNRRTTLRSSIVSVFFGAESRGWCYKASDSYSTDIVKIPRTREITMDEKYMTANFIQSTAHCNLLGQITQTDDAMLD